jgi:hypothetical protein
MEKEFTRQAAIAGSGPFRTMTQELAGKLWVGYVEMMCFKN